MKKEDLLNMKNENNLFHFSVVPMELFKILLNFLKRIVPTGTHNYYGKNHLLMIFSKLYFIHHTSTFSFPKFIRFYLTAEWFFVVLTYLLVKSSSRNLAFTLPFN